MSPPRTKKILGMSVEVNVFLDSVGNETSLRMMWECTAATEIDSDFCRHVPALALALRQIRLLCHFNDVRPTPASRSLIRRDLFYPLMRLQREEKSSVIGSLKNRPGRSRLTVRTHLRY